MKNIKYFLTESVENHAVLAFGRFNPPTTGHEKLIHKVKEIAGEFGASHHVVMSHTQDSKKNPLSGEEKLAHAKRFFPDTNLSTSNKTHPNFLSQAEKLHKSGVTHLHMVAGSDRTGEYHKILNKYNGTHEGALFNFKKITVHSAGERDPDSEGTEGMSASKMREHAKNGNIDEFVKGIPLHVSHQHTKELYDNVRKNMGITESYTTKATLISEGVNDRGIFKAVFLGGGPGSGKDYVLNKTLAGHGLIEVNSDQALEFLMDKQGLDKKMPDSEEQQRNAIRGKAKSVTELKQRLAINGRNGLIINGTADDPAKITRIKKMLEDLGYETSMIMVNTGDAVSQQRNIERGQRGGRTVPEDIRRDKWQAVQDARPKMAEMFGKNYVEFDNSEDLRTADPEVVKQKTDELNKIWKQMNKFTGAPPKHELSQGWIGSQKGAGGAEVPVGGTTGKVQGSSDTPSQKSGVYQQAMKMGLEYYGFGRYGKGGSVTYRDHKGILVPVNKNMGINEQFTNFINQIKGNNHVEEITESSKQGNINLWKERTRRALGENYIGYSDNREPRGETIGEDGRTNVKYPKEIITGEKIKISFTEARKRLNGSLISE